MALIPFDEELTSGLTDEIVSILAIIGIIFGILLVFAGRLIWKPMLSMIGGFIGATFGYMIGYYFGGFWIGLLCTFLGALIGSLLFKAFVEFALALLAGLVGFGIIHGATGNTIIAFIVLIIIFIIVSIFMEKIISVLTATVGAILVGVGLLTLDLLDITTAALLGLILIFAGSIVQIIFLERKKAAQPASSYICSRCGCALSYDQTGYRWYCPSCEFRSTQSQPQTTMQTPEPPPPPPPDDLE